MSSHEGPAQLFRPAPAVRAQAAVQRRHRLRLAGRRTRRHAARPQRHPDPPSAGHLPDARRRRLRCATPASTTAISSLVDRAIAPATGTSSSPSSSDEFVCRRLCRHGDELRLQRHRRRMRRHRRRRRRAAPDLGRRHHRHQVAAGLRRAMLALVDVNNMYVSCERVFRPALDRPAGGRAVEQRRRLHRPQQRGQGPGRQDGAALVPGAPPASAARG